MKNRKIILSIIWVFVLINMTYADILNTLKPDYLDELKRVSTEISGEMILFFAILMEIPILMILLSRLLPRKANRIAHFIAVPLCILWVVVPSLAMEGTTTLSYVFFATIEITAMLFTFWYAWKWPQNQTF